MRYSDKKLDFLITEILTSDLRELVCGCYSIGLCKMFSRWILHIFNSLKESEIG